MGSFLIFDGRLGGHQARRFKSAIEVNFWLDCVPRLVKWSCRNRDGSNGE